MVNKTYESRNMPLARGIFFMYGGVKVMYVRIINVGHVTGKNIRLDG